MIKYRVLPAVMTKLVIEYCEVTGFAIPECYYHLKNLNDFDLIGYNVILDLLNTIENNSDNNIFFVELFPFIKRRFIPYLSQNLRDTSSSTQILNGLLNTFPNKSASVDWKIINSKTEIELVSKRASTMSSSSKYCDIYLYSFMLELLVENQVACGKNILSVKLPFERSHYAKYVDIFENVEFESNHMSILVRKSERETYESEPRTIELPNLTLIDQVTAAANTINVNALNLQSLSSLIGISERNLQRKLCGVGKKPTAIIKSVKFSRAREKLIRNKGCIKRTAYECGYTDLSSFTRLFVDITGLPPREYVKANTHLFH